MQAPLAFPSGKVASAASRMRAGEHLRIALHAQQSATAPRPSSVCSANAPQTASPRGSQGTSANRHYRKRTMPRTNGRGKPLPYVTTKNVRHRKGAERVIGPYKSYKIAPGWYIRGRSLFIQLSRSLPNFWAYQYRSRAGGPHNRRRAARAPRPKRAAPPGGSPAQL